MTPPPDLPAARYQVVVPAQGHRAQVVHVVHHGRRPVRLPVVAMVCVTVVLLAGIGGCTIVGVERARNQTAAAAGAGGFSAGMVIALGLMIWVVSWLRRR